MNEKDILDLTIAERIHALFRQYREQKSDEASDEESKVTFLFYRIIADLPLEEQDITRRFLDIMFHDFAGLQTLLYKNGVSDGIKIMAERQD